MYSNKEKFQFLLFHIYRHNDYSLRGLWRIGWMFSLNKISYASLIKSTESIKWVKWVTI